MQITDKIKITNEDNMILMARYPDNYFDIAIVDPPYGGNDAIGLKNNKSGNKQAAKRKDYKIFENKYPDREYFKELFRVSKNQIIWGVNFYPYDFLTGGRLVWDKKGTAFGRAELAYLSMTKSVDILEVTWNGMIQQDMKNKEIRIHPTQKPVILYKNLLSKYCKPNYKILDTHLGSASIAVAYDDMIKYYNTTGEDVSNSEFVACELDADHFHNAIERLKKHTSQQSLF